MQLLLAPALSRGRVDGGMEGSGKTPLSTLRSWLIKALRDLLCFFYFRFISADDKEGEEYSKHAATANKKKQRICGSFFILF